MNTVRTRRRVVVDDRPLAKAIGERLRRARLAAGLTQQQLAGDRYTKAYISALENGIAKPSMAALNYLAPRLGKSASEFLSDPARAWARLEADLALASGNWQGALDGYLSLLDDTQERAARADLLTGIAEAYARLDRPAEAIAPATEAVAIYRSLARTGDIARAEYWLASAQAQQDNLDEARSILRTILDRDRATPELAPDFRTRVLIAIAYTESHDGEPAKARAYLEEARSLAEELDIRRRGAFLATLAGAYRNAGDLEGAIRTGLQAVALFEAAESDLDSTLVENQLALAYLALGNVEKARTAARRARATVGNDQRMTSALIDTEAGIELAAGKLERALELADEAIALAEQSGHSTVVFDALITRGRTLSAMGRHEEAAATFQRGHDLAGTTVAPSRRRLILGAWADSLAALGRHDEAFALARRALVSR
jgi:tetratricopeptide (TPR) repeat protein